MLRGLATINYWTDNMDAAKRWYAARPTQREPPHA